MKSSMSVFRQNVVMLLDPLKKHRAMMIVVTTVASSIMYLVVNIGLADLARQNSLPIHMLTVELLTEVGPCLITESSEHAQMVRLYVDHLEKRQLAGVLRVLYPGCSPEKTLTSTLSGLEKAESDEDAWNAIWKAGVVSNKLYKFGKRFPRSPIAWFESENLPDSLLGDLEESFARSHEIVNGFETQLTRENALQVCRVNRKTILLLSLARLGYNNKEKIEQFRRDAERAHEYTMIVAAKQTEEKAKKEVISWAHSEARRARIVEKMLANDMDGACELLRKAIKIAFEEKKPT